MTDPSEREVAAAKLIASEWERWRSENALADDWTMEDEQRSGGGPWNERLEIALRGFAAGVREEQERVKKVLGHTYHAAGCQFHAFSMNVGKACPDQSHEKTCAHCEDRLAAIRGAA